MRKKPISLLHLADKKEVEIELPTEHFDENGERINKVFTGVVTAQVIDLIEDMDNSKMTSAIGGADGMTFGDLMGEDFDLEKMGNANDKKSKKAIAQALKNVKFDLNATIRKDTERIREIIQAFFGEKYAEYEKTVEFIGVAIVNKNVFEIIQEDIAKEQELNKEKSKDGKEVKN